MALVCCINTASSAVCEDVQSKLLVSLEDRGFELYPFKVGWYNEHIGPGFELAYPDDTLAFTVISTPSFFEKCFIPFVKENAAFATSGDLLDQCIAQSLQSAIKSLGPHEPVDVLYDYEMRAGTRRPKVLVQTAGHVSGAAYFYQKKHVLNPPWPASQSICGVCLHPRFVGWFALRAVLVFKNILVPDLVRQEPQELLQDQNKIIELLNLFNFHWQDWRYRDVINPTVRYSQIQRQYFVTPPSERGPLIKSIKES